MIPFLECPKIGTDMAILDPLAQGLFSSGCESAKLILGISTTLGLSEYFFLCILKVTTGGAVVLGCFFSSRRPSHALSGQSPSK